MKNITTKIHSLDDVKNKLIGKKGSSTRNLYEMELQADLLGELIKNVRKHRNLTQEQLGNLVGVQKSQISKLENNTTSVRLDTLLKVFNSMQAKINFTVQL
jgi:DNA-binding XRE family transcriptional regulator